MRVADRAGGLPEALASAPAGERVALVDPRFVGHRHSLRLALSDPRHEAASIPGALAVAPTARGALAAAVRGVPFDPADRLTERLTERLAARLAAAGVAVHRPDLGPLVAEVPDDAAARDLARARAAEVDEEAVRLRGAVKARDGWFATHCVSPYSRHLARWCARRGLSPNQVTTASLLTALLAAGCAATGARPGYVAASALLLGAFVLDCADGQLARYTMRMTPLGGWLDATFDRVKEYAFYAGLALGAARGGDDVWALAGAAMAVQTCRHMVDLAFAEAGRGVVGDPAAWSTRLDRIGWTVWPRRVVVLPIGERWALLAVLVSLTTPRVTLTVLLTASSLAACYTTAGRLLRTRRRGRPSPAAATALLALTDTGPLARAVAGPGRAHPRLAGAPPALAGLGVLLGALLATGGRGGWLVAVAAAVYALGAGLSVAQPLDRPFDWLPPPLFRAAEYACVLILAWGSARGGQPNAALPAAFLLVAAAAHHHYDTAHRPCDGASQPARWPLRTTGGHEGRVLAVAIAAWVGGRGYVAVLVVLGGLLALTALAESVRFWSDARSRAAASPRGQPVDATGQGTTSPEGTVGPKGTAGSQGTEGTEGTASTTGTTGETGVPR